MSQMLDRLPARETPSMRTFSTSAGSAGFSRLDIAAARVFVKRLIQSGQRKGPPDFLILSDSVIEKWYDDEAVRYLHEKAQERKAREGVIEIK